MLIRKTHSIIGASDSDAIVLLTTSIPTHLLFNVLSHRPISHLHYIHEQQTNMAGTLTRAL